MAAPLAPGGMPFGDGEMPPGPISIVKHVLGKTRDHKGVHLPASCTPEVMAGVEAFEIREDDVILATYPKCGKFKERAARRCKIRWAVICHKTNGNHNSLWELVPSAL